jgi:hypothetical protein
LEDKCINFGKDIAVWWHNHQEITQVGHTLKDDRANKGTPSSNFPETRPIVRGDHAIRPTPVQRQLIIITN